MTPLVRTAAFLLLLPLAGAPAAAQKANAADMSCWVQGPRAKLAQRASAFDSASLHLNAGTVKVCYSRPQMRNRQIMGGLVPYGEPWRMGANEATAIHVPVPARIAGVDVKPGWYSLYAVPGESEWRIVVNGQAQRWGIPIDTVVQAADIGSGSVAVHQTQKSEEALAAHFEPTGASSADLVVEWDRTAVRIPVVLRSAPAGN